MKTVQPFARKLAILQEKLPINGEASLSAEEVALAKDAIRIAFVAAIGVEELGDSPISFLRHVNNAVPTSVIRRFPIK